MVSGSIVALVTPMNSDGSIDWESLGNLVEWHMDMGTRGLVPVGTTGESATIDVKEHCQIIKYVVDVANKRIPIIAGTGANATLEAIELTNAAKESGADACLLVTPYYNKPTQEGLYLHHKAIAAAVDLPQILYNVPGRTACDMLPETVAKCAEIDQVIAIKEATGNIQRTKEILELCGGKIVVYSGDDETFVDLILAGAKGSISVTANVAPKRLSEVCAAALDGNGELANTLNEKLLPLHRDLFIESNPIPVKWALAEMGKIKRGIRLPMTELAPEYHEKVRQALRAAELIPS